MLVLGIDAGGTKTAAAIGDNEQVMGSGKSGAANLHSTKLTDIKEHLKKATRLALRHGHQRQAVFSSIVVGMSGIDSPSDEELANKIVRKALLQWSNRRTHFEIVNDVYIVRRSGSNLPYGMALIAGTGANALGINKSGKEALVSGMPPLLADEGSGYYQGVEALHAAVRSADGRTKKTTLERAVLNHFDVKNVRELVPLLYGKKPISKHDIANLSLVVERSAVAGDWKAEEIMQTCLTEHVLNVKTLANTLRMQKSVFDIVVAGGIFHMPYYPFLDQFRHKVKKIVPHATVVAPTEKPVIGALRIAQNHI